MVFMQDPGNWVIRNLIGGFSGFSLLYGTSGTGKSTICLLSALSCKDHSCIYLDTVGAISSGRIEQLYGYDKPTLDNILTFPIKTFEEQCTAIDKMARLAAEPKIRFLIVDSLTSLYRIPLSDKPKETNTKMVEMLVTLKRISREKPVLVTAQVYESNEGIIPVGGSLIKRFSDNIIKLSSDERGGKIAYLEKPSKKNQGYLIVPHGIVSRNGHH